MQYRRIQERGDVVYYSAELCLGLLWLLLLVSLRYAVWNGLSEPFESILDVEGTLYPGIDTQ